MTTVIVDPTGTDDHLAIAAAIASLGAGDTVQLSTGTFDCAGSFNLLAGVSLIGTTGTILQFPNDSGSADRGYALRVLGSNTVAGLDLRGAVVLSVEHSDVTCTGLISRQELYGVAAFRIYVGAATVENITFTNCHAIDTSGFGFYIGYWVAGAPGVRNITFRSCTATNCGALNDLIQPDFSAPWICGFDFGECTEPTFVMENVLAIDCTATGCWESGFYAEFPIPVTACRMVRCTATNNGLAKVSPTFAAGFCTGAGWTFEDCTSTGNGVGYLISAYGGEQADAATRMSGCAAVSPTGDGFQFYGEPGGSLMSDLAMSRCAIAGVAAPAHCILLSNVTGAQITALKLNDYTGDISESGATAGTVVTYYVAPFGVVPGAPYALQEVAFSDVSDNDALTAWAWAFGDGDTSTLQNPAHSFAVPGAYPVTLTAGGTTVTRTIAVREAVVYGGVELSEADLGPLDHDPTCTATDLHSGRVGLQGSPVSRRAWTINALADDHAEIEALAALKGQHLTLNLNGVEYPGVMIRPPMLETQLTPAAWAYQIGFVQETRHA